MTVALMKMDQPTFLEILLNLVSFWVPIPPFTPVFYSRLFICFISVGVPGYSQVCAGAFLQVVPGREHRPPAYRAPSFCPLPISWALVLGVCWKQSIGKGLCLSLSSAPANSAAGPRAELCRLAAAWCDVVRLTRSSCHLGL